MDYYLNFAFWVFSDSKLFAETLRHGYFTIWGFISKSNPLPIPRKRNDPSEFNRRFWTILEQD